MCCNVGRTVPFTSLSGEGSTAPPVSPIPIAAPSGCAPWSARYRPRHRAETPPRFGADASLAGAERGFLFPIAAGVLPVAACGVGGSAWWAHPVADTPLSPHKAD